MEYRIGLDIGTASVGLVAASLDENGGLKDIVHSSLLLFSEPTIPAKGTGELKNVSRRAARMARRQIDRKARRHKRVAMLAPLLGLESFDVAPTMSQTIHELRVKALDHRIELDELLRIISMMSKRRGYSGGFRRIVTDDEESGIVQGGIINLKQKMSDLNSRSIGEYLLWRNQQGLSLKLKNDSEAALYFDRELVRNEFKLIMTEQRKHHPILDEVMEDWGQDPSSLNKPKKPLNRILEDALFYQRPLKSIASMVASCPLEPTLPRSPKAQPAVQGFRIEKQIADLRWGVGRNAKQLSATEKIAVREILHDPDLINKDGTITFDKIYKNLTLRGIDRPEGTYFNVHRGEGRKGLSGDRTRRAFHDLGVIDLWDGLTKLDQIRTINFLADIGSPEICDAVDWEKHLTREGKEKDKNGVLVKKLKPLILPNLVVELINTIIENRNFGRLASMGFETGRSSYSIKACQRLTDQMIETNLDEYGAIQTCYPTPASTGELFFRLEPPERSGNIIVDGALRMVQKAVNDCIDALGKPPKQMIVEMARDLPLGVKMRQEIEKKQNQNSTQRRRAEKEIRELKLIPSARNVDRFLLWEELETHCPYCENRISLSDALNGGATHLDHILPRTLTQVGARRNQLVLCHNSCNSEKGNRTPFEAFGHTQIDGTKYSLAPSESKRKAHAKHIY